MQEKNNCLSSLYYEQQERENKLSGIKVLGGVYKEQEEGGSVCVCACCVCVHVCAHM